MQPTMQPPSGGIRRIQHRQCFRIISINYDQIRGFDTRKMRLIWVQQKPRSLSIDRKRKMVRHSLMHIEPRGPAKGRGQINATSPVINIFYGDS